MTVIKLRNRISLLLTPVEGPFSTSELSIVNLRHFLNQESQKNYNSYYEPLWSGRSDENHYLPVYLTNLLIWTDLQLHPIAILHILLNRDNSDIAVED